MQNTPLQTQRLNIRPIELSDLDFIHHLHSLPETDEFNTLGIPEKLTETKGILENWINEQNKAAYQQYVLTIELLESEDFLGLIALKTGNPKFKTGEVWYKLHVDYWGKGYATEALLSVLTFAFRELKLHRIEAGCAVENKGSFRVLEKAGMQREGWKRKVLPLKTGWSDNFEYAILEEDFERISSNKTARW